MTNRITPPRRGSYGIDAPYAAAFLVVMAVAYVVIAILVGRVMLSLAALFLVALAASYLHATLRGKFLVWAKLLDSLNLRGDERILDLGCGRGAVLLMAAQHLTTGRAVGVDLWRGFDQSGNSDEATRRNAVAEGVADRVEVHTADMTALPFADDSFDVIVSSLAIHNISGRAGREKAISEAVRVLRPGGRLMIADIRATRQHREQLAKLGMSDVARRRLVWQFWWAGPWAATRLVTATKPDGPMEGIAVGDRLYPRDDFEAVVRIYSAAEGGRRTPTFNGIRWDFAYTEGQPPDTLYMIWPDFFAAAGQSLPANQPLPVGVELSARFMVAVEEMWVEVHQGRIAPGVRFFCHEGGRRVAEGVVTRITRIHTPKTN